MRQLFLLRAAEAAVEEVEEKGELGLSLEAPVVAVGAPPGFVLEEMMAALVRGLAKEEATEEAEGRRSRSSLVDFPWVSPNKH